MPDAIAPELHIPPRWSRHVAVLAALASLAIIGTLLVWLHPTLGYMRGGILDGADLRGSMIALLWWSFLVSSAASTLVLAVVPPRVVAPLRYVLAYGAGASALVIAQPFLDRYY